MAICSTCQGKGVVSSQNAFSLPGVCSVCRGSGRVKLDIKDLAPHDHACFLYENPADQLATAVSFMTQGLKQGECCFYITDENSTDAVKDAFERNGVNVKKQLANRALNIITKKESYLSSGSFDASEMLEFCKDAIKAATRAGFMAFRGAGEMSWALGNEPGCDQLIIYETLIDEYFENVKPDVISLCQYNVKRFPISTLQGVLHTHKTAVLEGGRVVSSPYYQDIFRTSSTDFQDSSAMMNFLKKNPPLN